MRGRWCLLLSLACGNGGAPAPAPAASPVRVVEVVPSVATHTLSGTGTVRALDSAELRPEMTGLVESVEFSDGARVSRGDVLLRLRSADATADALDARSRAGVAAAELERARTLFAREELTQVELDRAVANDGLGRAAVGRAEEALRKTTLRAPFDGVVGKRQVSPGELVDPSRVVTRLDGLGALRVDLRLPETDLPRLVSGLPAEVSAAALPGETIPGTVAFVSTHVDEASRTVELRVAVDHPRLRPGMTASVRIVTGQTEQAVLVPSECVVATAGGAAVWVVGADGKVSRRAVTLGQRGSARVEVTSGLASGERIVSEGLARLREGAAVEVLSSP